MRLEVGERAPADAAGNPEVLHARLVAKRGFWFVPPALRCKAAMTVYRQTDLGPVKVGSFWCRWTNNTYPTGKAMLVPEHRDVGGGDVDPIPLVGRRRGDTEAFVFSCLSPDRGFLGGYGTVRLPPGDYGIVVTVTSAMSPRQAAFRVKVPDHPAEALHIADVPQKTAKRLIAASAVGWFALRERQIRNRWRPRSAARFP